VHGSLAGGGLRRVLLYMCHWSWSFRLCFYVCFADCHLWRSDDSPWTCGKVSYLNSWSLIFFLSQDSHRIVNHTCCNILIGNVKLCYSNAEDKYIYIYIYIRLSSVVDSSSGLGSRLTYSGQGRHLMILIMIACFGKLHHCMFCMFNLRSVKSYELKSLLFAGGLSVIVLLHSTLQAIHSTKLKHMQFFGSQFSADPVSLWMLDRNYILFYIICMT
jgi:hypothetical protein